MLSQNNVSKKICIEDHFNEKNSMLKNNTPKKDIYHIFRLQFDNYIVRKFHVFASPNAHNLKDTFHR